MLEAVFALGAVTGCGPDDQRAFHRVLLNGVRGVSLAVDARGELFHSLHREIRPLRIDAAGQLHVLEDADDSEDLRDDDEQRAARVSAPCVSHGNAGDGKALYANAVAARYEALQGHTSTVVRPALLTHGLELWRRGLARRAIATWRERVRQLGAEPCAAVRAVDLHFNLGVLVAQQADTAHQDEGEDAFLNAQRNALAHYEQALLCEPHHFSARTNAGAAHFALGDWANALLHLERAAQLRPHEASNANVQVAREALAKAAKDPILI